MRRRDFGSLVCGAAIVLPRSLRAQQPARPEIGFLSSRSATVDATLLTAFHKGLAGLGFVEGRDVTIAYRWAEGRYDQLPALAAELVARPVAVLVSTGGTVAARAAKAATQTIPIVFTTAGDPVAAGLVESLARPGGNLTGITASFIEAAAKRMELLHELLPKASTIGFLVNPANPAAISESDEIRVAAGTLGQRIEVVSAMNAREIEVAFDRLRALRADALLVAADPFFFARTDQLVAAAARQAIPTLYFRREFADAGGLISFGSNFPELFRVVGQYAGQILRGAHPSDLPVQRPSRFELVINLRTASALGLAIPPILPARADAVIE
ncbi:ABC transporter substrate-binding protein [Methylobacterium soli]|uniref:ABC transporter substrate-binding protein n=2 Tax=Methylobacterium soli TaxID=553447 RepID=A0A6L3SPL1_9HYPH|nr:ABC transporter substrate-binding protein [Methylobacterium soli]KAB1071707.1 ABC transporter substrate-binding protein [Methylobacterium soli]